MSWHFSRALVEEYLEENSLDGGLSALLKLNPTPQAYLSPDRMKAFSKRSLCGMTFAPLTDACGEDLLTWFREDFLAKTSAPQAKVQELKESVADCGEKWFGSLMRYDLDSRSWKTRRSLESEDWIESSPTLPKSGSMRNGFVSAQRNAALGISENVSGFLPTIGKNEFRGSSTPRYRGSTQFRGAKMSEGLRTCETDLIYIHPCFAEEAMGWPIMWTELAPLGMDKFQSWLQQHGIFYMRDFND